MYYKHKMCKKKLSRGFVPVECNQLCVTITSSLKRETYLAKQVRHCILRLQVQIFNFINFIFSKMEKNL